MQAMLRIGLLLALSVQHPPTVDSLAVYSAILEQVRAEFPARAVALAQTRSGVDCMPLCGVQLRDPGNGAIEAVASAPPDVDHSVALLDSLRARGLIQDACAVREGWYGCPELPEHLFVALGEITSQPRRGPEPVTEGVWVKVALLVPCTGECTARRASEHYHPEAFGYWYLLRQEADGTWVIIRRAPGFTT
jgi:hypothetical protein